MEQKEHFLEVLRQNPRDAGRMEAFARWWERRGDHARATLVRIHALLDRPDCTQARMEALQRLQSGLLSSPHLQRFIREDVPSGIANHVQLANGVIEGIWIDPERLRNADEAALKEPHTMRRVFVEIPLECAHSWDQVRTLFAAQPQIDQVSLMNSGIDDDTLGMLLEAKPALRCLCLDNSNITLEALGMLVIMPVHTTLEELSCDRNPLGDRACEVITGPYAFPTLRRLSMADTGMTARGVTTLAHSSLLSQLQDLNISSNPVGDEGIACLAARGNMQCLRSLYLLAVGLADESAHALARMQAPCLEILDIDGNNLGPEDLAIMLSAPWAPYLQCLSMAHNRIGDVGAAVLRRAHLPDLRQINLAGVGMTDKGFAELAMAPLAVESLNINCNDLTDASVNNLVHSSFAQQLIVLDVSSTRLSAPALRRIVSSLVHLRTLIISPDWSSRRQMHLFKGFAKSWGVEILMPS